MLLCYPCLKKNNERQVMQPFRAPRGGGKAMIRQVIKESQAIDENPVKAKGVVKGLSRKASTLRRSPRKTGKQDTEVHSIPYKKGIKMMSEREASECAKHGEVLRWRRQCTIGIHPRSRESNWNWIERQ